MVGLVGFFAPFLGATMIARFVLGWSSSSSWLAGVALSTTSVAVVYAVMHGAWGFGFLAGSVRFGPPLAALARIARRRDD